MGEYSLFLRRPQIVYVKKLYVLQEQLFCTQDNIDILLPVSDKSEIKVNLNTIPVSQRQAFIAQKNITYCLENSIFLNIRIRDVHISGYEKEQLLETPYSVIDLADDADLFLSYCFYLQKMYEGTNFNFAKEEILESIISALLLILLNKMKERLNEVSEITQKAKKYIEDHFKEDITLTMLAEKLNFSVYYLAHSFKKEMGFAPMQYLMNFRMEKAKELMQTTNLTILDIAQQVGYSNANYFNMLFKKIVGITPGKYRKKCKKQLFNNK